MLHNNGPAPDISSSARGREKGRKRFLGADTWEMRRIAKGNRGTGVVCVVVGCGCSVLR